MQVPEINTIILDVRDFLDSRCFFDQASKLTTVLDEITRWSTQKVTKESKALAWRELLQYYYDKFVELYNYKPGIDWAGRDRAVATSILKGPPERTLEQCKPLVDRYLKLDNPWLKKTNYPFNLFAHVLHELTLPASITHAYKVDWM